MRLLLPIILWFALAGCADKENEVPDSPASTAERAPVPTDAPVPEPVDVPWLPDAISLPEDFVTVANRSIGRATRILQGRTDANVDVLLADYRAALTEAGYQTRMTDERILFQGNGIAQGSIVYADTLDMGPVLQIDATLDTP